MTCQRTLAFSFALASTLLYVGRSEAAERIEYNRHIRPILAENCFACHGPDSAARKAKLRLDVRDEAVKMEAIVPGKPEKSAMLERILAEDESQRMPPPKTHKVLTTAQKDMLRNWIAAGAEYQVHWSLLAPTKPVVPTVKESGWARNPIDHFILAELEKRGLKPAPEADRRTLARRLSLDLTGLPPEPRDVQAFVNDNSPDAYERYVDRLLKSPDWGEHRGRYWLDAARFADTHGIHFDNYREIWAYRDWVIRAFNRNIPFDQFTIEQLAGDLLPNRTLEQQIASGFNRCNITTNEGGAISEEYLVLYTRDRTETTSQVWLGLTAGCAVCHDHKFDPLSQREFYELAAFFNNTTQGAMDGNIKDTPPILLVPNDKDRPRWDAISKDLTSLRQQADARKQAARSEYDKWLAAAKPADFAAEIPTNGLCFHADLTEGKGKDLRLSVGGKDKTIAVASDKGWAAGHVAEKALKVTPGNNIELTEAGDFDRTQAFSHGAWVRLAKNRMNGALWGRMDEPNGHRGWDLWIENGRVGTHIINTWPSDAVKVIAKTPVKAGQYAHVFVTYDGSGKASGVKIYVNGQPQDVDVASDNLKGTTKSAVPFKVGQRHSTARMDDTLIQDLRIYDRALPPDEVFRLARTSRASFLATKPADKRAPAEKDELFDWWLPTRDKVHQELTAKLTPLQQEEASIKLRGSIAHVMQEKPAMPEAYILFRGEYDKRRDPVKPSTPRILPAYPPDLPKNRLGLAHWLLRPDQPLTARVTVNRFWQEVFGTGIVRTSGDFGVSGELPSHPELLDWLALEFRDTGWDMKRFFKMLVTSATYRQAATTTREKLDKDAQNRFLSRGPRFRMDGEVLRDYALSASGLLVRKLGGPSVKPYQPEGVWEAVAMIGSNTRDYRRDSGSSLYRRSMYTFWKRSAPPASLEIFNAPNRETCAVRRERTNTPLQALVTLNDPQYVEAARILAQNALLAEKEPSARLDYLSQRLLARSFRPEERKIVQGSLVELLAFYKGHAEEAKQLLTVGEAKVDPSLDAPTLAAWAMLANELFNLDEVLNK